MKKKLTVVGVALHVVSCVLFALYEQILFTRPSIFLLGMLVMVLSFIVYYAEAVQSIMERTSVLNVLKLISVLIGFGFLIAFWIVIYGANDKFEVFCLCFAVYYLLQLVLQIISLLKKEK